MVDRTIFGQFDGTYVLRVSRPGYDVKNTALTPNQLAFDSRWQETGLEYMSAVVVTDGVFKDVYYGVTFPTPPLVIVRIVIPDGRYTSLTSTYTDQATGPYANMEVYTDRFRVTPRNLPGMTTDWPATWNWYYTVYRNVYG